MSSVNFFSQQPAAYYQDIIQSRQQRLEDRLEDGVESGSVTGKNKEALDKLKKDNDEIIGKALADKKVTREEYERIMKALDDQNRLIDHLAKDKAGTKTKKGLDARTMDNQDMVLSVVYSRLERIEKSIDAGIESGKIDQKEKEKLQASLAKTRELLDKAMEDGAISRGELSEISRSQSVLNREVTTYSRNRRYASLSSRYSQSEASALETTA